MNLTLPAPRVPDPMLAPPLRWGVLGTGWIAARFTEALHASTSQRMVAAASRDTGRAAAFAQVHGLERSYGAYEQLVADPGVDIVYVATPHHLHLRDARLALEAGKHVLIEKPIALDGAEARELAELARATGLFCMEALWTAFLPKYDVARQVVESGMLGELRTGILDHGQWFPPDHRILRPELAGGSLLDLATYTVAVADDLLGPGRVVASDVQGALSGVEGQVSGIVVHDSGARSVHHSSVLSGTPTRASISGSNGLLDLEAGFYLPGPLTISFPDGREPLRWEEPRVAHRGLFWQAAEVARRITDGETGSPWRTLDASIRTMDVLDQLRTVAGYQSAREQLSGA